MKNKTKAKNKKKNTSKNNRNKIKIKTNNINKNKNDKTNNENTINAQTKTRFKIKKSLVIITLLSLGLFIIFLLLSSNTIKFIDFENLSEEIYNESTLNEFQQQRDKMIETQLKSRGITDENVLKAMQKVPRHLFMPHSRSLAYNDHPVPIGYSQTISQPFIVALMAQELKLKKDDIVLEIGAGSGYNAAVLAEIVKEVYTIEIIEELAKWSKNALKRTGYNNVFVKHGDGYYGIEGMEFDAIIITASPNHVPQPLINQLKDGGRLIVPLSSPAGFQTLNLITKQDGNLETRVISGVRFVPMTGKAQKAN